MLVRLNVLCWKQAFCWCFPIKLWVLCALAGLQCKFDCTASSKLSWRNSCVQDCVGYLLLIRAAYTVSPSLVKGWRALPYLLGWMDYIIADALLFTMGDTIGNTVEVMVS